MLCWNSSNCFRVSIYELNIDHHGINGLGYLTVIIYYALFRTLYDKQPNGSVVTLMVVIWEVGTNGY